MMAETMGLVNTLNWKTVDALKICVRDESNYSYFGSGQLESLKAIIDQAESNGDNQTPTLVSSVFLSTHRLSSFQRINMEKVLDKPVIDR